MHKVVIVGGGPIGLTCAALLAQRRIGSLVIDAKSLDQARQDGRLLALSRGTWDILAPLLGSQLPPRAPIRQVIVSSAGDFGATRISSDDFDGTDLGATVRYGDLLAALATAVHAQPAIEIRRPIVAGDIRQRPDRVEIALADGSVQQAEVLVRAEGAPGATVGVANADAWALLADVGLQPARHDVPDIAYERFTRDGPLALLPTPMPIAAAGGRSYSLVWCMDQPQAQRRLQLAEAALLAELQTMIGTRIGHITSIGPRRAAALPQRVEPQVLAHRAVAVGNAAQTLHPVAGQGFNLGVRDCATLADAFADGRDVAHALASYVARRRADRAAIAILTDRLPALFASRFAPLALARGIGLTMLDLAPALRREFAHLLMFGLRG